MVSLSNGEPIHLLRNVTRVEFLDLLVMLQLAGDVSSGLAEQALRSYSSIPAQHHDLTQPMAIRIWELRSRASVQSAANVALVERLQADEKLDVALATMNPSLKGAHLPIRIEVFA